jgi:dTDP-glucose 4,6-dehydratase
MASSGAVTHKAADYRDGYVKLKRDAEQEVRRYPRGQTARIFSVIGPGIPLDAHYAASSFLSQALAGGPVVVKDGAIRSYLHPKDLAAALLTILAHGDGEPYDVGGEERITVADLGRRIAAHAGVACHLAEPLPSDVYLPDLTRLHALGWKQTISTDEAITDTLESLRVRA